MVIGWLNAHGGLKMSVIKVFCHTNIDKLSMEKWPREMVLRPMIGDWVKAESGRRLRVVAVTHCKGRNDDAYLDVELHN